MRRLIVLLALAAAPLPDAARERLASTERASVESRQDSAAAKVGAAAARRRAANASAALPRLTARVEASERRLAHAERVLATIERQQIERRARLASWQQEATRLLAVLQTMARRPAALTLVQPGSATDIAHARMALDAMTPGLRARTVTLRTEFAKSEALSAKLAAARDRESTLAVALARDRNQLARVSAEALRDESLLSARAIEQARVAQRLSADASSLRDLVARLSPVPGSSADLILRWPAGGELTKAPGAMPLPGALALSTLPQSAIVGPAAGRVSYAGLFRSYGGVVILDHGGGWRSILSGLGSVAVRPGAILPAGTVLGRMPLAAPILRYELRRGGVIVDPLPHFPALACHGDAAFAHGDGRAMNAARSRIEAPCRVRI